MPSKGPRDRSPNGVDKVEDVALVERALVGEEDAYAEIVRRYERPVFSLVVRMVRDRQRAEEISQEAFLKAFRALRRFDRSRKFSSWLFKIAHNTAIDSMRRGQLDTTSLDAGEAEERSWSDVLADEQTIAPDRQATAGALRGAMERAVGRLRPEYREAFVLRFGQGLAYQEIADVLDLPMGTVKTNIHRARKEFARLLEEEGFA